MGVGKVANLIFLGGTCSTFGLDLPCSARDHRICAKIGTLLFPAKLACSQQVKRTFNSGCAHSGAVYCSNWCSIASMFQAS